MTPARRRVVLYWLLLLGPALLVGASTVWLLRREQARLEMQSAEAAAARQQALEDRAGLVAENLAVLLDDVRDSLGQTLAQTPVTSAHDFLEGLRESNDLVTDVFGTSSDGRILWGGGEAATRAWLGDAPRSKSAEPVMVSSPELLQQLKVASNVDNYAQARSQLREIASANRIMDERKDRSETPADQAFSSRVPSAAPTKRKVAQALPEVEWTSVGQGETAALYAWIEPQPGARQGLAVNMRTLREQLMGALPVEAGDNEDYAIQFSDTRREADGVFLVGISTAWLPGWMVAARWGGDSTRSSFTTPWAGLVTSGVALVLLLIAAILVGGVVLLRDARRNELEALQKTTFVGNVSHEFKTPLTTIRLYAELLEQGRVSGEAKQRDYLQTISRESARLTRLVNNALDFSRLEQGQKRFDLQPLDVTAQVDKVLQSQIPRLTAAGMQVERAWPDAGIVATCDRDTLDQVLLNLVDNAIKYASSGKVLSVGVARVNTPGVSVEIRVEDRGPGVAAEDRERIFGKFARLEGNLATEQTGTGLGLAIARQLARGHGGDLWCESRPGGGSSFVCRLSCAATQ